MNLVAFLSYIVIAVAVPVFFLFSIRLAKRLFRWLTKNPEISIVIWVFVAGYLIVFLLFPIVFEVRGNHIQIRQISIPIKP
jgi:cytochrome c biogenesis protein CcdA